VAFPPTPAPPVTLGGGGGGGPNNNRRKLWEWNYLLSFFAPTSRRARRRKHLVPYMEWVGAFGVIQRLLARAYDEAIADYAAAGNPVPPVYGSLLRVALNAYLIPEVRAWLAANPGVEDPKQVLDFILKKLDELLSNEEKLKDIISKYLKRFGIAPDMLGLYLKVTKEIIPKIKEYLPKVFQELNELVAKAAQMARGATATA